MTFLLPTGRVRVALLLVAATAAALAYPAWLTVQNHAWSAELEHEGERAGRLFSAMPTYLDEKRDRIALRPNGVAFRAWMDAEVLDRLLINGERMSATARSSTATPPRPWIEWDAGRRATGRAALQLFEARHDVTTFIARELGNEPSPSRVVQVAEDPRLAALRASWSDRRDAFRSTSALWRESTPNLASRLPFAPDSGEEAGAPKLLQSPVPSFDDDVRCARALLARTSVDPSCANRFEEVVAPSPAAAAPAPDPTAPTVR